jgi:tyrosinase
MSAGINLRKNIESITPNELQAYRDAIRKMQAISDNRGFSYWAGIHGLPQHFCEHVPPLFLPWHRAYLYTFEQYVQDQASGATIPWWDWTSDLSHSVGVPTAFSDVLDAQNKPNPLLNSYIDIPTALPPIKRYTLRFPLSPTLLPPKEALADVLSRCDYTDFSNALLNLHDYVHGWTGGPTGDMGVRQTASFDPIFFTHHSMVDRIWYLWQTQCHADNIPLDILDIPLQPFNLRVRDVLDISRLGYLYADSSISNITMEGGINGEEDFAHNDRPGSGTLKS